MIGLKKEDALLFTFLCCTGGSNKKGIRINILMMF